MAEQKIVLVTGGAGFIGSHVAEILLARGDRVVIVDEMNDYYDVRQKQANLEILYRRYHEKGLLAIHRGDICDVDFIGEIFETERPSHICHLAARAGVRPSIVDPYIYVHSNVEGTTRLLDLARQYKCKNFVYASSSSVYGNSPNEVLSESDVVEKPVSPYAATKKACELFAYTFHHLYGLNCTGLRFFTVYGPRGRPDMAPFKFISRVFSGTAIQQFGDGTTSRDYTYIDDIADGVVAAVDTPLGCEVLNLGNGRPFQLSHFIGLVEKSVGKEANIEVMPKQPGDVDRTCADISKARELLGYNPKVPFEEGIRRTAEWYMTAHAEGLFSSGDLPAAVRAADELKKRSFRDRNDSITIRSDEDSLDSAEVDAEMQLVNEEMNEFAASQFRAEAECAYPFSSLTSTAEHIDSMKMNSAASELELSAYVVKASTQVSERHEARWL